MKQLRYEARLMVYNIVIFVITMLVILFASTQTIWYFSLNNLKNQMLQTVTDLTLYVQERTTQFDTDEDIIDYFNYNSTGIYTVVSSFSDFQLEIFDLNGNLLDNGTVNNETLSMNEEFEKAKTEDKAIVSIKNYNGVREMWLLAPIKSNNQNPIGYIGLIAPLNEAETIQLQLLTVLSLCILGGLVLLYIATSLFSKSFMKPIRKLTRISSDINSGDYDRRIQYKKDDEIGDLAQVYNEMTQSINKIIIQLRGERERLGSVLASLDDGLLALDQNGEVITSNRFIRTYFDLPDPKTIDDLDEHPFFKDIFESLKKGKTNVSEEVEVGGRILLITGSPIIHHASEENYLFIIRNITTARTLEKEQRKFISSISHELRTPLTTIIGYTDMLSRRNVDDRELLNKSLNTINREGHRLVRLVDDLLNANSIENMVFSIHKEKLNLEDLLNAVVEQMRTKSLEKEIEIVFKAQPSLPKVYGDNDRLSQTFINIIHNAIKFSSRGGIIDVVLTQEDEENLSVSIRDYGTGIDPAKKDFIFSAFYRVEEDRARNEGEGGAGLGLYLVKQIVDKHDGKIRVDSEVEEGTNITVILPIAKDEKTAEDESIEEAEIVEERTEVER